MAKEVVSGSRNPTSDKKSVVEVREFTSGVTWRVEVYADGTTGRPVPGKMWTSEPKVAYKKKKKKKDTPTKLTSSSAGTIDL